MSNIKDEHNFILGSVCRVCFESVTENKYYVDLFSEKEESREILEMIRTCFQIILNQEKHLPNVICKKCVGELNIANNFRIKCIINKERFKEYCENKTLNKEQLSKYSESLHSDDDPLSNYDNNTNSEITECNPDYDNKFRCDKCSKVLKSMPSLLKHVVLMHDKRKHAGKVVGYGATRRYHCTNCTYSTPHSQTLVNHMRRHNGERPFSCECGKKFTQMSSLTAHQKIHSKTSFFTCSQCGKQFKHAFSLKTHIRVHENGQFDCKLCKKVLKSKKSLHSHMRRHYKIYNYNCEECGDTFVTSAELYNHKTTHVSVKNIKCSICDYTTNSKKNITLHLKRHMGDKTYNCNYCDKSFFTQADLRRHMRVHTKEKPYSCQTCAQRFAYSSSLNKHMLVVHGVQFKWSDVKSKENRTQIHTLKAEATLK